MASASTRRYANIVLNGRQFAYLHPDRRAPATEGAEVAGYFRKTGKGLTLYDASKARVGGINRNRVLHSSHQLAGSANWWHSYATPAVVGEYESWGQQCEDVAAALRTVQSADAP